MQNSISLGQVFLEGKEPTRFYIFGYVRYASVFGSVDEVGFCFEHLIQINKFIPCAESKYVYRKRNLDKSGEQPCHSGGPKSLSPLS